MKSADEIKKFFKSAAIDTNPKMDEEVLNKVLIANEKTTNPKSAAIVPNLRRIIMKNQITKYAAVLAIVIVAGAISVVGVNIGKIYYYGKNDDGAHIFISDDLETVVTTDEVTDVEQKVRDLEEMKILSQQGKKELLQVEITMVDGNIEMRMHEYKYELSDGRTNDMREGVEWGGWFDDKERWQEWRQVKKAGPGEDLGTYEETVEGRVFSFKRERYFLSEGTEVIWSVGTPKDGQ